MTAHRQRGFTLVELVVTLVIAGIVVGFMALFMVTPVEAYLATARRAELNDSANSALRVLTQDIHKALPGSVRGGSSGSLVALEILLTRQAIRYRETSSPGTPATELAFGSADNQFNVIGAFADVAAPGPLPHPLMVGYTGGNYPTTGTITPAGTTITIARPPGNEDEVTLTPAVTFTTAPAGKLMFVLQGPVKYLCNTTAGVNTLTRYEAYAISPTFAVGAPAGATVSVVSRDVTGCSVNYVPASLQHGELVLLQLTISRNGETLNVMQQVQVENTL